MRKKPTSNTQRARTRAEGAARGPAVSTARAATPDELEAIAQAQQGQLSAESFWKAAGRLTKLR